jgi:hypothetical protein
MNEPSRQQIKSSIYLGYLIALAVSGIAVFMILNYQETGVIISHKTGNVLASGKDALLITIGISTVSLYLWGVAIWNSYKSIQKLKSETTEKKS